MSVNEDVNNSKSNICKMTSRIYFSPYAHKKKEFGNLFTEPRKFPIQTDLTSKNKFKQKINNPTLTKNIINIEPQESFRKGSNFLSQINDKSYQQKNSKPQSYKKINTKLYLKKNAIPNIYSFDENNSNTVITQKNSF